MKHKTHTGNILKESLLKEHLDNKLDPLPPSSDTRCVFLVSLGIQPLTPWQVALAS